MKNFVVLPVCVFVSLSLASTFASAAGFDIDNTTSNSGQTLSSGTGTVTSTGTLSVNNANDVTFSGTSTLTNAGLIVNTGTWRALRDNQGGGISVTVSNTGTIEATQNDTFQMNKSGDSVNLTNSGLIEAVGTGSFNGQALDWAALTNNTGTNTLINTGTITAADSDSVRPGQNGTIDNDGLIQSSTIGDSGNDGIDGSNNTNITIVNAYANNAANSNTIEGARHGITAGADNANVTMNVTNNSNGKIIGDNGSGINIDGYANQAGGVTTETVTVVNHGLIQGNGNTILSGETTADGDGVDIDGIVNIANTGTIVSKNSVGTATSPEKSEGVTVGGGTITNSGLIEGDVTNTATQYAVGRGITLAGVDKDTSGNPIATQSIYADSVVTNQTGGKIIGGDDAGIAIEGTGSWSPHSVTINNNAGAFIEGNYSSSTEGGGTSVAAIEGGVTATNLTAVANNMIINNAGVIDGNTSGKAIDFGNGTNQLNITGGVAQIHGNITGGTGTTTISINTGSGNSFNYAGTISKVQSVSIAAGSTFAAGGMQSGTTANGNTTIDTTGLTSGSTVITVKDATLNFALGTGGASSGSKIVLTGGVANNFTFDLSSGDSTVAINDLTSGNLVTGQEYVLIQGSSTTFQNLTLGATSSLGTLITGGLDLEAANAAGNTFGSEYSNSELYLQGDNIVLDVVATPEPGAWALGLIALGGFAALRLRQRANAAV